MSFIDWELESCPQNFGKLRCSTVIDRQTLTHVICNMDSPEGVERDVFARVMSEVAKTLDKVPFCEIEQQSEWISVKDRLPADDATYLVYARNWYEIVVAIYYGDGKWLTCDDLTNITRFVTHWMPMPMPPKEEHT